MKKIYSIKDIRENKDLKNSIYSTCGYYQWWCEKDFLIELLEKLKIDFNECIKDIEKIDPSSYEIINKKGTKRKTLYCIYVGDTKNLKRRISSNHLNGTTKSSTFRKDIAAVMIGEKDKEKINKTIDRLYVEWNCEKNYHEEQNKSINRKFRPLNNKEIKPDNKRYSEKRHYYLTSNKKSRTSSMLRELRTKLN